MTKFTWSDIASKLLLDVVLEYKLRHNIDWEESPTKYQDIYELFLNKYQTFLVQQQRLHDQQEGISVGEDTERTNATSLRLNYCIKIEEGSESDFSAAPVSEIASISNDEYDLLMPTKANLSNKLKAIRHKYRQLKTLPDKITGYSIVDRYFNQCEEIFGEYECNMNDSCSLDLNPLNPPHSNFMLSGAFTPSPSHSPSVEEASSSKAAPEPTSTNPSRKAPTEPSSMEPALVHTVKEYVTLDDDEPAAKKQRPQALENVTQDHSQRLESVVQDHSKRLDQMSNNIEHLRRAVDEGFQNIIKSLNQTRPTAVQPAALDQCPWGETTRGRTLILRLLPGMALKQSLLDFCSRHSVISASISTCVGSLTRATIRLADGSTLKKCAGPFEIVSLVGVIAGKLAHIHISLSDSKGHVIGGHLVEEDIIHTTAEVVLNEMEGLALTRELCPRSGWPELVVRNSAPV